MSPRVCETLDVAADDETLDVAADEQPFEWPPELVACSQPLSELDGNSGDQWVNLKPYNPNQLSRLSISSGEDTEIIFVNNSTIEVLFYWLDYDRTERYYGRVAACNSTTQGTFAGHFWIVKDQHGKNLAMFQAEAKTGRAFIGPQTPPDTVDDEQQGSASAQLAKVSGDNQQGLASAQLAQPFVVSVLDQDGSPLAGVDVTFSVTTGGGMLSATTDTNPCTIASSTSSTTATTDTDGQAATRLTLGSEPGRNTVSATVEGLESVTFTATAAEQAIPYSLTKVCGDNQEGTAITLLDEPLVVFASDEDGAAMAGVVVSFAVTAGGGTLSATTATADANGRAATWLTLGIEAGINAVAATVEGLEPVTFTATAQESPFASFFDLFRSGKRVALPDRPQLAQNAPNPFNSQTVLSYFLSKPGPVRLEVFALSGQRVAVLHQGPQEAGYHRLHWAGRDDAGHPVASGVYLYRLVTDEAALTRKLILLR